MKRLLLLLMLVSQPAWAEWVEAGVGGEGSDEAFTLYIDPATVRKTPGGRRVWTMYSFEKPQSNSSGGPFQSARALWECDCAGERTRILQYTWHSGHMGAGRTVAYDASPSVSRWVVAAPGS